MSDAEIFFDGACLPFNPNGVATYGFVIKNSGKIVSSGSGIASEKGTNNIAEYTALIKALEKALELGYTKVKIYGDSLLVVNQINGIYEVKSSNIYPLYEKACKLLKSLSGWKIQWIRREKNIDADKLSRYAFIEYIENKNRERAQKINPEVVQIVGPNEFRVGSYIVRLKPPFCSCPYFEKFNSFPLMKKDNIIIKCKHILIVEKLKTQKVINL
jgi:ribonuclease HI